MASKKLNYETRETTFAGETIVLYSIDGVTWSTRKEELAEIMERHEYERTTFGDVKGRVMKKGIDGEEEADSAGEDGVAKPGRSKPEKSTKSEVNAKSANKKVVPQIKAKKSGEKPAKAQLPKKGANAKKPSASSKAVKKEAAAPKKRASSAPVKKLKGAKGKKKTAA